MVWRMDATVESVSIGALQKVCNDVLPIVLALFSLFTIHLQVHYMCLREHAWAHRRNFCIGTPHPKRCVRAMMFGLLLLCPTIAYGGRTPAMKGIVRFTLGNSGTGSEAFVP